MKSATAKKGNQAPNPTIRQQISSGPQFHAEPGLCVGCGGFGQCAGDKVDRDTGLGEACWRVWRWSSIRERQLPNDEAA